MEQLYRNNYSIYNYMFYNIYYGLIGKRCFSLRWRCLSYMEIAPLAPPLCFGPHPAPRSCQRSSTLRSESGKRRYSITAKRMISGLVLKYLNGECFVIRRGYETSPARLKLVLSDSAPIALNQHASCRHWNRFYNGITSNRHELINHIHSDADMVRYNT